MTPLLDDVASKSRFPFDKDSWPGRELYWCWRNPLLTLLILIGGVAEIVHLVAL